MKKTVIILICSLLFVNLSHLAYSSDISLKPFISLSEEYTSSVQETSSYSPVDWITRIQPGASFNYASPWSLLSLSYAFDYQKYAKETYSDRYNHVASFNGKIEPVKNLLFFDLSDSYRLVSSDVARDITQESLNSGLVKQNLATVDAYFQLEPYPKGNIKTGYRFLDARYFNGSGIDKSENGGFIDLTHRFGENLSISTGYSSSYNATAVNNIIRHEIYAGFNLGQPEKTNIYSRFGNSWQRFEPGGKLQNLTWKAGASRVMNQFKLTAESSVNQTEDPLQASNREISHKAKVSTKRERFSGEFEAGYSEFFVGEKKSLDRKKGSANLNLTYQFADSVNSSMGLTLERFSIKTASDYPYRFVFTPKISKEFNYGISTSLTYSFISYRHTIPDSGTSNDIHRLIAEVRKAF